MRTLSRLLVVLSVVTGSLFAQNMTSLSGIGRTRQERQVVYFRQL